MSALLPAVHDYVARTPRARIRRKRLEDVADDYRWRKDPELQHFNAEPPYSSDFDTFRVQFELDLEFRDDRRGMYSIEDLHGMHVGNLMYYNADHFEGTAEFGMTIAEAGHRDGGLGRELAAGFLNYAWRELPFRRYVLHTLDWNVRAQKAFAAAGFEPVAVVRRAGRAFVRMEARREYWLLHDTEGAFAFARPATEAGRSPTGL